MPWIACLWLASVELRTRFAEEEDLSSEDSTAADDCLEMAMHQPISKQWEPQPIAVSEIVASAATYEAGCQELNASCKPPAADWASCRLCNVAESRPRPWPGSWIGQNHLLVKA